MSVGAHDYEVFGLRVASELPLWPGQETRAAPPDVEVRIAAQLHGTVRGFTLTGEDTTTVIEGAATVRVQSGRLIELCPTGAVDVETLSVCAAGAGLAMACHQRGLMIIHGSCVARGDRALCIAGHSGVGKSTLAVAVAQRGMSLLSDGMTVFAANGALRCLRGPRMAKLWPDSLEHLGWEPTRTERVTPAFDKRLVHVDGSVPSESRLTTVLIVKSGDELKLEASSPGASLMGLVKHAYLAEYLAEASAADLLEAWARVAGMFQVRQLTLPRGFSALERAAQLVEAQLEPR